MNIQDDKSFKNFGLAIAGGATASIVQTALLSPEAKASIKNTMFGQDHFLKKTIKCAKETYANAGKKFDIDIALKNAKSMYPVFEYTAKNAIKKVANTFAATAGAILLVKATQSAVERIKTLKNQEQ